MFENIFIMIILFLVAFFPIALWGYFFGYIDNGALNKQRFFLGIVAWWLAVFPVLYLGEVSEVLGRSFINIFEVLHRPIVWMSGVWVIILSLVSVFVLFSVVPFFWFYFTPINKQKILIYLERLGMFVIYFTLIAIGLFLFQYFVWFFPRFTQIQDYGVSFGSILFDSLYLVIIYYLIIGIIEEVSKFLFVSFDKNNHYYTPRQVVTHAIFIALGFAFIENFLYFSSLFDQYGFGSELISTYVLRNLFSVFLHILCSSIFAYYFSKVLQRWRDFHWRYIVILFEWFFLTFLLHAFFDIFLTLDFFFIVFIYFIGGYFYFTSLFYKD